MSTNGISINGKYFANREQQMRRFLKSGIEHKNLEEVGPPTLKRILNIEKYFISSYWVIQIAIPCVKSVSVLGLATHVCLPLFLML